MLDCNYDVCKNGFVQNKKDLNCLLGFVLIPTVGNRFFYGSLYIITANFMNIATSYEWFVWYCVRSLDFCNIPFCQMIFFINSLYYQWKSVEKISGKGSKIYWHVPSLYLKKLKRFLTEIYDENYDSGSFIHSEVFGTPTCNTVF